RLALLCLACPLGFSLRVLKGRARRRAHPLALALIAVVLAASALLFVAGELVAGVWLDHGAWNAAAGLLAGLALSVAGLRLARFDGGAGALFYTGNDLLASVLVLQVAARVALAAWPAWHRAVVGWTASGPLPWLATPAGRCV